MSTTRIFVDERGRTGETITLTGDRAHYLLRVLRVDVGDEFIAIDPAGNQHTVVVESCTSDRLDGEIVASSEPPEQPFHLAIYQSLLKGDNFELVIQKCTELGAGAIIPIVTDRTVKRPKPDRIPSQVQRWEKIAREACRQCGRVYRPDVPEPMSSDEAIQRWKQAGGPGIIPYEALAGTGSGQLRQLLSGLDADGRLSVFVGPEGGFSPEEVQSAKSAGLDTVSLGGRIIRAETAAIAISAIVMYEVNKGNPDGDTGE